MDPVKQLETPDIVADGQSSARLVLVDDHSFFRSGVRLWLEGAGFTIVGEASTGDEAGRSVPELAPDVVLMDLNMPKMDGLTATREVLTAHPQVRVVVLTGALTPVTARAAKALGAAGYLLKEGDPADLPDHVRAVAAGETVWHPLAAALTESDETCGGNPSSMQTLASPYRDETPLAFR